MKQRLGDILVARGVITQQQLDRALALKASQPDKRVGAILIELDLASEDDVARALAQELGLPFVDPTRATVNPALYNRVPREVAERRLAFPLERERDGGPIRVAMASPNDMDAVHDVEFLLGSALAPAVATPTAIRKTIQRYYQLAPEVQRLLKDADRTERPSQQPATLALDAAEIQRQLRPGGPEAYINLLNLLLVNAIERRASDIHLEPEADDLRVRFRVDGMLREMLRLPRWAEGPLTSRIKVVGELDVASHRRAQDGKVGVKLGGRRLDLRISVVPSQHGEKVVIRLLDPGILDTDLGVMGWPPRSLAAYFRMVSQPQGLVLVVGPTGSGKSTTLYATIQRLRKEQTSIVTVEDPIEYSLEGISQIQVDEKAGMTFANSLRSLLRQDPNVLVIGEIRDNETALAATEAASTGHLVLSTLHTAYAIGAITRILDLGVPPYLLGNTLVGAVSQRLVRKVCTECSAPGELVDEDWQRLNMPPLPLGEAVRRAGKGCMSCQFSGYAGRVGVFEVLLVSDTLRELILDRGSERQIWATAREEGFTTMLDDALHKVQLGLTTLEEVTRVVPVDPWRGEVKPARAPWLPTWAAEQPLPVRLPTPASPPPPVRPSTPAPSPPVRPSTPAPSPPVRPSTPAPSPPVRLSTPASPPLPVGPSTPASPPPPIAPEPAAPGPEAGPCLPAPAQGPGKRHRSASRSRLPQDAQAVPPPARPRRSPATGVPIRSAAPAVAPLPSPFVPARPAPTPDRKPASAIPPAPSMSADAAAAFAGTGAGPAPLQPRPATLAPPAAKSPPAGLAAAPPTPARPTPAPAGLAAAPPAPAEPALAAAAPASAATTAAAPVAGPAAQSAPTAEPEAPPSVLVVDDADEILRLLTLTLEDGFRVRLARDGVEALEAVAAERPDLIVLDVMMPRMNGYDVCLRLREKPETQSIPVLMLSARGERAHITRGLYAGADDYLPKPFDPEELLLRIRALLRRSARQSQA